MATHSLMMRTIVFLWALLVIEKSFSQSNDLRFEHITTEEGLGTLNTTSIFQDSKGYVWFGTLAGLIKYDGNSLKRYQHNPYDSTTLSQNAVYFIWEDKSAAIWVGTSEGLCKFDRTTEKFRRYRPNPKAKFWNPNISTINQDIEGMIWVGTYAGGLCRFDPKKGVFLDDEGFDIVKDSVDYIYTIYKDQAGTLWVGHQFGLHEINLTKKKAGLADVKLLPLQSDPNDPNSLSNTTISSILEDRQGILWLCTDKGLVSIDRKRGTVQRYRNEPKNIHSIGSNDLAVWGGKSLVEDKEGNLWIGSNNGLYKFNKDRTSFSNYYRDPNNSYSLNSDSVWSLLIDSAGSLWAGSFAAGPNKTDLEEQAFNFISLSLGQVNSLMGNEITSILEDRSGIVWIGTKDNGLNSWNRKSNQFSNFRNHPSNPKTLKYNMVLDILEDKEGRLWVCNGEMLSEFNKQTSTFTHFQSNVKNANQSVFSGILSITEDHNGMLWLGTGNGIKRFDKKTHQFEHFYYNPFDSNGVSDYTANAIFADSRNNIWVGNGSMRTDRFDQSIKKWKHFKNDSEDSNSISANIVMNFLEDEEGKIWMGTYSGGLCYFDYQKNKFTTFTEKHGLPENSVYSFIDDKQGGLWLGTMNGLSHFSRATGTFTNYDEQDGLQSNRFDAGGTGDLTSGSSFMGRDGILYFGSKNGIIYFDPAQIKPNTFEAPIVITQFKLFDKLVKGANESKKIVLAYDENYFSFEFAALNYYKSSKNQFAYKLEGVDKDWVYSGSRRYAGYTNIDPGSYVFKVKLKGQHGVWREMISPVSVIIRPPWWKTGWAYALYGLAIITGLFFIDRYLRRRAIGRERERAREKELAQAREIESAYRELKRTQAQLVQSEKMASLGELTAGIAHEIQNPLNFVNNFSEVNTELIEEMQVELDKGNIEQLKGVLRDLKENELKINQHGKRADSIVKGMLQHSRTTTGIRELVNLNNLTDEYLRLSFHGVRAKDKSFNVSIQTAFDDSVGLITAVPQDIGRLLLNLFNNAFYSMAEKKALHPMDYEPSIFVSTKKIDDKVMIGIRDNGTGIPQQLLDKIFQPFFTSKPTGQGTGLGLSLAYDIVKAHEGELKVETQEGVGAEFIIELPAENK